MIKPSLNINVIQGDIFSRDERKEIVNEDTVVIVIYYIHFY